MPCYEIRYIGVLLDLAHQATLRQVANERGLYAGASGQVQIPTTLNADEVKNEIKRAYTEKKILEAGKKFNWQTKKTAEGRFEFVRR